MKTFFMRIMLCYTLLLATFVSSAELAKAAPCANPAAD